MAHGLFRKKSIPAILKEAEQGLSDGHGHGEHLKRVLGVRDLTFMGIAAVIGAGIFSSIGKASYDGGPGVVFLYIFTAVACGFAALCYAQFASTVPVSGSAYTYSYVAFGEIFAWIIGWDLLMEYAIGNIAVAISWSDYFTNLMQKAAAAFNLPLAIPEWLTMDYVSAKDGFANGTADAVAAWTNAPQIGNLRVIMDLPALGIVALITWIVFRGVKESRNASNIMVILKLIVIFFVIVLGAFYVNPDNWTPFTPTGVSGILKGVSAVFFAYIGFDAISTTAEECKNPQRDLPKGMINSLIICTILYVLLALVLTGMVPYTTLSVGDPLAMVFDARGLKFISAVVAVSAIVATASVLLVFQLGQPRIWMSMSRDGLLPKIFSRLHPKYKTPSFSTILTGFVVAVPALFLNLNTVLALTSIGTLFAFVLVCAGVLVLQKSPNKPESKFKVPHVSGRVIVPLMLIGAIVLATIIDKSYMQNNLQSQTDEDKKGSIALINSTEFTADSVTVNTEYYKKGSQQVLTKSYSFTNLRAGDTARAEILSADDSISSVNIVEASVVSNEFKKETPGVHYFKTLFTRGGFPMAIFWVVLIIVTFLTVKKNFSLIPVLGLTSCFYLMAQESATNWERFLIWLVVGLVIYFFYGYKHSHLNRDTIGVPRSNEKDI